MKSEDYYEWNGNDNEGEKIICKFETTYNKSKSDNKITSSKIQINAWSKSSLWENKYMPNVESMVSIRKLQ